MVVASSFCVPSIAVASKGSKLTPKEEAIVQALGKLHAGGIIQPKRDVLMVFSNNRKTPEAFKKNMGSIKKKGYFVYPDAFTVALSDMGEKYVGNPEMVTNETFHEDVIQPILGSKKAWAIFLAIRDGKVHNKQETAKKLKYNMEKLSGYDKDLSKMKTLGYLNKTATTIQLTDNCFPRGRPS